MIYFFPTNPAFIDSESVRDSRKKRPFVHVAQEEHLHSANLRLTRAQRWLRNVSWVAVMLGEVWMAICVKEVSINMAALKKPECIHHSRQAETQWSCVCGTFQVWKTLVLIIICRVSARKGVWSEENCGGVI